MAPLFSSIFIGTRSAPTPYFTLLGTKYASFTLNDTRYAPYP